MAVSSIPISVKASRNITLAELPLSMRTLFVRQLAIRIEITKALRMDLLVVQTHDQRN